MGLEHTATSSSPRAANWLAAAGGLMQFLLTVSILFLPVFATCQIGESSCFRQSYIQMGGNVLGYILFSGLILIGVLSILSTRDSNRNRALLTRWIAAAWSLLVA